MTTENQACESEPRHLQDCTAHVYHAEVGLLLESVLQLGLCLGAVCRVIFFSFTSGHLVK